MLTQFPPLFRRRIQELQSQLTSHPVYSQLTTITAVRRFMSLHVFAVWDFMVLLKRLQRQLSCVDLLWTPSGYGEASHLVNQIVVAEESDGDGQGGYCSHFELYCRAMSEVGADGAAVEGLVAGLELGEPWPQLLAGLGLPEGVEAFVRADLELAAEGSLVEVAAAFVLGRELLVPPMFEKLLAAVGGQAPLLRYYLQRHMEVDGEEHGPMAERLLQQLCGGDAQLWNQAAGAAASALERRLALWDSVLSSVREAGDHTSRRREAVTTDC